MYCIPVVSMNAMCGVFSSAQTLTVLLVVVSMVITAHETNIIGTHDVPKDETPESNAQTSQSIEDERPQVR